MRGLSLSLSLEVVLCFWILLGALKMIDFCNFLITVNLQLVTTLQKNEGKLKQFMHQSHSRICNVMINLLIVGLPE